MVSRLARERPGYVEAVLDEVRDRGPIAASELTDGGAATGPWWGWADGKAVLEWLFWVGELSVAGRRNGFERIYDLTERVVPRMCSRRRRPRSRTPIASLVRIVANALGVATRRDIFNYLYLRADRTGRAIAELVEAGELLPVRVDGWSRSGLIAAGARAAASSRRPGAAGPVRLARLRPGARRAALRDALPDRDLHPGAEAGLRLLRHAVPARRHARRARGPEGRPGARRRSSSRRPTASRRSTGAPSSRPWPTSCACWPTGSSSSASRSGATETSRRGWRRRLTRVGPGYHSDPTLQRGFARL